MKQDKLDILIDEIESDSAHLRRARMNRTYSLDARNSQALQDYCVAHKIAVSAVLDRLIEDFLDKLQEREAGRHKKTS